MNKAKSFLAWATVEDGEIRAIYFSRSEARYAAKGRFRVARIRVSEVAAQ